MKTITPEATLGELVTAHPTLAREMERRGLDYCCGGRKSLAEACGDSGIDVDATIAALVDAAGDHQPEAWSTMGVAQLVKHVEETHHRYLWDEMPRLSALLDKIVMVHGGRHPELADVRDCFTEIRADLEPHMHREEQVVFPMIAALAAPSGVPSPQGGSVQDPISVLIEEHDTVGDLMERMSALTSGYQTPADGCATYQACYAGLAEFESDTHLHVHKENNVLFPAAIALEQHLTHA
ncbi:MAG: iron-sulfur cluster repair di-iron protein [Ilumatobacteraceae bacterium]